jgi:FRG domain
MIYERSFENLFECVSHLRSRYNCSERTPSSRDIDTGEFFKGNFPRWLFRGEANCYPFSRPGLWRLRRFEPKLAGEIEAITDFAYKYTAHHLVLPYTSGLDHFTNLKWMAISTGYEALAFCQHYGLPTAFVDFTPSLTVAASFASAPIGTVTGTFGRIAVLDAAVACKRSQLIDLRHFSATRAARQKGFAVYVPRHANLCDLRAQRKLGITWYRFRRCPENERRWQARFPTLLRTDNDRLAGWLRHAISIYARLVDALSADAAHYLCARIPVVPLIAHWHGSQAGISFEPPIAIQFDPRQERLRTIRDWSTLRKRQNQSEPFTVYRRIPGTRLVRFVGT